MFTEESSPTEGDLSKKAVGHDSDSSRNNEATNKTSVLERESTRRPLPAFRTARDIARHPTPQRQDIIHGVLKQGSKLMIAGKSKMRKTWKLIQLAVCVSLGLSWLNLRTKKSRVLYVNFELSNDSFEGRLRIVCDAMGIDIDELGDDFIHWCLRGEAASYKKILPRIIDGIQTERFGMVIIDPVYKILGGLDENKAGDITKLMNALEDVARETKASIVYAHHFSKGDKADAEDGEAASGSGVFLRDPDAVLEFKAHKDSDKTGNVLSCTPILREHPPMDQFCAEVNNDGIFEMADDHDPEKLKGKGQKHVAKETLRKVEAIKDVLRSNLNGLTATEWKDAVLAEKIASDGMFYKLKREHLQGWVVKNGSRFFAPQEPRE
jgi:hypothetical protein